jgi:glycosyltransferase involved in cell wall biosynthesis
MRVVHVVPSIAAGRGGPTYVVLHLARALADLGEEVRVVATRSDLRPGDEDEARRRLGGVPLTMVPIVGTPRAELAPRLPRLLWRELAHADVVHVHTVFTFPVAITPPLCRALGVRHVVRPAGTLDATCLELGSQPAKRLALAGFVRRNLAGAGAVHATSALEAGDLRALVPDARVEVIAPGVELPSRITPRPRARRVGTLGRLHPIKRLEPLIDAMATFDGELWIAGDGDPAYRAQLEARARGRTRFLGHLDEARKRSFLDECDVLVFPSSHESFGVAVAEAMAAARPVVVSPEVGLAGEIAEAGAGRVAAAEPRALAEAIGALLDDGAASDRAGAAGRALVESRYTWTAAAERTRALYARLPVERAWRVWP